MMKKRMVCILLVFALTAAGATACGTAGTDAGDSAQEAQTESSAAEEVAEEEGEKAEPDAAENLEVNEYGLTEQQFDCEGILLRKPIWKPMLDGAGAGGVKKGTKKISRFLKITLAFSVTLRYNHPCVTE